MTTQEHIGYNIRYNAANPYLNTPPTKLRRDIKNQKDPAKKKLMQTALNAWRTTVPGPFRKTAALELTALAKACIMGHEHTHSRL